ncbi:Phenylacetaldehyde dehydrogenase [Cedecea neteri]|uniref:Phenylacetaldehyde dehydrogenase n=1 Tax=Cedecea neteri TaxID=158822 RepID=A0A2X3J3V3_9ENTR|nr:Phenylacetaldehyde dehydrogenase [Cedecea neteri]
MRYTAGLTTKISGQTLDVSIPMPEGARYQAWTRKEPVGVVAGIVPWNFPLLIGMWKVMPALAAGCSIVVKPSETTPLTLLRMAELADRSWRTGRRIQRGDRQRRRLWQSADRTSADCQSQLYRFDGDG